MQLQSFGIAKKAEEITYSGMECNSYLYFSFDGEFFDTDFITAELKIKPTSVRVKKEPVPKLTSWKYRIDVGNDIDLESYLEKLVALLEPKIEDIKRLKNMLDLDTRLQFVIDIDMNPDSSTPYFGLNKRSIDFLSKTGTEVDFDLYKADTIGLLKNE